MFPTPFSNKLADGINPRRPHGGREPRSSPEGTLISANMKRDMWSAVGGWETAELAGFVGGVAWHDGA